MMIYDKKSVTFSPRL